MADEGLLEGLDPFDLLDEEADRVHRLFLASPDWSEPSRCPGWSVRAMLGHLMALEDYVQAGLSGTVAELIGAAGSTGALDVAAFNAWGIGLYADVPTGDLVGRWREANLRNRFALRARGRDGSIDSSVGPYPSYLQTFHFAVEYATHGDDVKTTIVNGRVLMRDRKVLSLDEPRVLDDARRFAVKVRDAVSH